MVESLFRPVDELDEWVDTTWIADHLGALIILKRVVGSPSD